MVVTLLSDGLTDISHKSITNYIGQNLFRTLFIFAIKRGIQQQMQKNCYWFEKLCEQWTALPNQSIEQVLWLFRSIQSGKRYPKKDKKSPFTLVGGCMAHQTNIFIKTWLSNIPRWRRQSRVPKWLQQRLVEALTSDMPCVWRWKWRWIIIQSPFGCQPINMGFQWYGPQAGHISGKLHEIGPHHQGK